MTMPIAFGITDLDVGGAERCLVQLVEGLDRKRWQPSVVCLEPPGPLARRLEAAGTAVESLEMRGLRDIPRALAAWSRILRQRKPALLQTMLFHANLLGRIAARRAGVPTVLSGLRVAERRRNLHVPLDRWTRRMVDGYVCVSEGVAEFARQRLRVQPDRIFTIPNGVDVGAADVAPPVARDLLGATAEDVALLYVGRLDRQKGLDVLLDAVEILKSQNGGIRTCVDREDRSRPRLSVSLVGDGPLRQELMQSIAARGLTENIRLVGWQPNVYSWMKAADGLVLPSRWEGMANVLLEAMACRLPIIATQVEGSRELVVPGANGWLVSAGRPVELARAIEQFLFSTRRRQFGDAGRQIVDSQFRLDAMVAAYDRLYCKLLGINS